MMNKVTILGSGTSTGVPILGCPCSVCQSTDARNQRLRTSALLEFSTGQRLLIDATPDLRTQLLREKITDLSAVLITHDHADHTHGMDDLRPLGFKKGEAIPVYCDEKTAAKLTIKFPYIFDRKNIFKDRPILGGGIPLLDLHTLTTGKNTLAGEEVELFSLSHGYTQTLALQHRGMAYITDCVEIPAATLDLLTKAKLEILLIDCLRYEPHSTHLHFERTMEYIEVIKPRTTALIHLGHEMDYRELLEKIRMRGIKNVFPAVDGMSFLYS